jgi:hypothetical protein
MISTFNIELVERKLQGVSVPVWDFVIDDISFQDKLKSDFPNLFNKSRFSELFMPDISGIISKSDEVITAIYRCTDDCCDYIFAEINQSNNMTIWNRIGRNSLYVPNKKNTTETIDWIKDFKPISFNTDSYYDILKNCKLQIK